MWRYRFPQETSDGGTAGTGSTLTGAGAGGVVEIDAALKNRWDNYRLSPDTIWVASQVANDLSKKILAGNANAAQRSVFESDQGALGGGVVVRTYLNEFSMAGPKTIDIRIHPNMPAGALLMTSRTLPCPPSNVGNVVQVRTRQDYYQIEWPPRARRYETGVYADEVLQHYFPPSMAVIGISRRGRFSSNLYRRSFRSSLGRRREPRPGDFILKTGLQPPASP